MPKVIVQEGNKQRVFEYEGGRITFGQKQNVVVQLSSPGVAGLHFEINDTPDGFRLKDLASSSGTKLNGKTISAAYLRDGDKIQAGKAKITFWESDEAEDDDDDYDPPSSAVHRDERREKPKRISRRASSSGTNPVLIIMSTLGVIGICALIFHFYFSDALRAGSLYSAGSEALNRADYESAMNYFSQIDPNNSDYGHLAEQKYKEAKLKRAKSEAGGKLRELRSDLYKIFAYINANKHDVDGGTTRLKVWIQENAEFSPALAKEAQEEIDKLQSGYYSKHEDGEFNQDPYRDPENENPKTEKKTANSAEEEFENTLTTVSDLSYEMKFQDAIDNLNAFKQKYPLKLKLRRQADEKIEAVYEDARKQYQKLIAKANELASSGKKKQAKSKINEIIDNFGLEFYIAQAKAELKKLD